jgi:uncharacterized protein (TIGR02453 family)
MRYSVLRVVIVREARESEKPMNPPAPVFSKEIFQFFRELAKHNKKTWMDVNRERYKTVVTKPFHALLEQLSPALLKIDANFDVMARSGGNFSRINRDIRFAKDKTPYRAHMYLKVSVPLGGEMEGGELYVGIAADSVTVGFRIYAMPKRKASPIALVAEPKLATNPRILSAQRKRLSKKYESYWYETKKKEWTKNAGWPTVEDWPRLQGWIVRKKFSPASATKATFTLDVAKSFRDLYPLLKFTSL